MLDRPRRIQLTWALACLWAFAAVAVTVAVEPSWLTDLDDRLSPARDVEPADGWFWHVLRTLEIAFGTLVSSVATIVLAGALLLKRHRRAALLVLAVMFATHLITRGVKLLIERDRPGWQHSDGFLASHAFPSGHASAVAAFAGLVILLAVMLVRRRGIRRLIEALMVLVALAVGADRLLLGRHWPTDVLGGYLLGVTIVLVGLALYSPLPRSHAEGAPPLPMTFVGTRDIAVILNPIKVESVEAFQAMVTQQALAAGWNEPSWHFTTVEDSGTGQAHQAAVEGADLVIVCGGDGTVREVCAELAGTGIPVGIVPAGTGNLLARNLELPLFIRAAIDIALTGQDRAIDMVEVSGDGIDDTHFLVMAGMGFDAAIMEGVNEDIKKKVGWLAYVLSALKALMFPTMKLEVSVDGGEFQSYRARTCVIGNVGMLQGGMVLMPDATIDDGQLDVVMLYPRKFLSWIPMVFRILSKREKNAGESVARLTGRTVTVRASADVPRQLDGDSIGTGRELTMTCVHGRLLVRVPR